MDEQEPGKPKGPYETRQEWLARMTRWREEEAAAIKAGTYRISRTPRPMVFRSYGSPIEAIPVPPVSKGSSDLPETGTNSDSSDSDVPSRQAPQNDPMPVEVEKETPMLQQNFEKLPALLRSGATSIDRRTICALLLGLALGLAIAGRYTMTLDDGMVLRLDRWTGRVSAVEPDYSALAHQTR